MSASQGDYDMDTILSQRRRGLVLGGLGALALVGCGRPASTRTAPGYVQFDGLTMGSTYTVKLKAAGQDTTALRSLVQSTLDETDWRMSLFREDSELSAFNRVEAGVPFAMTDGFAAVLAYAVDVSRWSGGAFDITVAPLVETWGFGPRKTRTVPAATELADGRRRVDWRSLVIDESKRSVVKRHGGLQADLGGIAKGYGVDRVAAALDARSVEHYMVEAGGEVRTRGVNAVGESWRIGIEEPDAMPQRARWAVPLSGSAMATSGDYRNYFMHEGRRYSHEIDPASGAPIQHRLCSVTVVADDCMHADALATALIVLGPDKGKALAERSGIAAQFIERGPNGAFTDSMTTAFAALAATRT
jgi:thiamine biosynthesis lipoprotein